MGSLKDLEATQVDVEEDRERHVCGASSAFARLLLTILGKIVTCFPRRCSTIHLAFVYSFIHSFKLTRGLQLLALIE